MQRWLKNNNSYLCNVKVGQNASNRRVEWNRDAPLQWKRLAPFAERFH